MRNNLLRRIISSLVIIVIVTWIPAYAGMTLRVVPI
jgi:hypothetical protein